MQGERLLHRQQEGTGMGTATWNQRHDLQSNTGAVGEAGITWHILLGVLGGAELLC
jgi:hypothetical protein